MLFSFHRRTVLFAVLFTALVIAPSCITGRSGASARRGRTSGALSATAPARVPEWAELRLPLELLADAAADRRNVVLSPFGLSGALGMAALGARGETLAQLDAAAGTGSDPTAIAERAADTRAALFEAAEEDGADFTAADSLWTHGKRTPLPDFARRLKEGFDAEVLAFGPSPADSVNRWIARKTDGAIRDAASGGIPPDAQAALVDAVRFKARWAVPFERERTAVGTFFPGTGTPQSVRFMNLLADFDVTRSPRAETIDIPYRGNRFRMRIVLPARGVLLQSLIYGWLRGESAFPGSEPDATATREELALSLPKFSFESSTDVADALRRLGAKDAFDPSRADFSGMFAPGPDPFFVGGVFQRAVIETDERGTTASAATSVSIGCAVPAGPEPFVVDRPFAFFLLGPENEVLFVGAVFDAAAAQAED